MTDELTLVAAGQAISGWDAIRVTRGCERVPADFDLGLTESYPGDAASIAVKPGDRCQVRLGADLVISGYVDRVMPALSASQHSIRVSGRSAVEDLVDSSAIIRGMAINAGTFLPTAQAITAPFNVPVKSLTKQAGATFDQFNIVLSETPYEIIERIARYLGVLVYDDTDGALLLADVGATTMASGATQGVNVQAATAAFTMDERYQVYQPALMGTDTLEQFASLGGQNGNLLAPVRDAGVPTAGLAGERLRQLVVVSEQVQPQTGASIAELRAQWEMARRRGRSQVLRCIVDSWRDAAGALWAPNAYAPISLPALKLEPADPWIIAQVTFMRELGEGTTAELILMPKDAFSVEPTVLVPFDWQIGQALRQAQAAGTRLGHI